MINNQNIAILSEKVAALEAAIKNAGIELPEVTGADNGKALQVVNGVWNIGDVVSEVIANPEGEAATLLSKLGIGGTNYNVPHTATDIAYDGATTVKDKIDSDAYKLDIANISRVQVTKNEQGTDYYLIWRTDSNNAMQLKINSTGITMNIQSGGTWTEIWTK